MTTQALEATEARRARGGLAHPRLALAACGLAIAAMAVDHLIGDDPGLEDPPTFLISVALTLGLAALLFWRLVPRAQASPDRAARDGLIMSVLAIIPGVATLWLGLPFVLAAAGLALGLDARRARPSRGATATAIGAIALAGATVAYLVQAVDKLA